VARALSRDSSFNTTDTILSSLDPYTIVNDTKPGRLCTKVLDALQISVPTQGLASLGFALR
jgi:hypothetical protein